MGLHLKNEVAVVKTLTVISNNPVCVCVCVYVYVCVCVCVYIYIHTHTVYIYIYIYKYCLLRISEFCEGSRQFDLISVVFT